MRFYLPEFSQPYIDLKKINSSLKNASSEAHFLHPRYISSFDSQFLLVDNGRELHKLPVILREEMGTNIFELTSNSDDRSSAFVDLLNVAFLEIQGALRPARSFLARLKEKDEAPFAPGFLEKMALHVSAKGSFYEESDIKHYREAFERANSPGEAINMLRKLWRVFGPTIWLTQYFNGLVDKFKDKLTSSDLMFVAAYLCETGDYRKSLKLTQEARKKRKETWFENRYLGLTNLLVKEHQTNESWALQYSDMFSKIVEQANALPELIYSHRKDLVVVGNSPNIIGTSCGKIIDSSSLVIRFNTAETRHPFSIDVGRKTDVLVMNPDYSQTRRNFERECSHIVVSNGDLYSSQNIGAKIHDIPSRHILSFIPSYIDRFVTQAIGASPSSGLKMLYWIYSIIGELDPDRLFGFSMGEQPVGHATSYSAPSPTRLPIVHDWHAEQQFFNTLLQK
jgi:hypothetical protein